jgi:hypothetical protein
MKCNQQNDVEVKEKIENLNHMWTYLSSLGKLDDDVRKFFSPSSSQTIISNNFITICV